MKKLLLILILASIFLACDKESEPEEQIEAPKQEVFDPKISYIKILKHNPVDVPMPRYVYMDYTIAYHISTEAVSGQGFKITGTISIDNRATRYHFYDKELYVRTDTLIIRYQYMNNHQPKDSIRINFSLKQRTSPNYYNVLSVADSLVYKLRS